jgi:hypothetical protein
MFILNYIRSHEKKIASPVKVVKKIIVESGSVFVGRVFKLRNSPENRRVLNRMTSPIPV